MSSISEETASGAGPEVTSSGTPTWESIAGTGASSVASGAEAGEKGEWQLLQKVASEGLWTPHVEHIIVEVYTFQKAGTSRLLKILRSL